MSAITPIDPTTPPKNGRGYWVSVGPETKAQFQHPYLEQTRRFAENHRLANNLPIGVAWREQFLGNVCLNTPGAACKDASVQTRPTLAQLAKSFGTALAKWARDGFSTVPVQTLESRRGTCHDCDFWGGDGAYFGLGKCRKCGCSGLKLFLPTERCPIGKW